MGATTSKTITEDGNHKLAELFDAPEGVVVIKQAGTGTWTLKFSPDEGVTLIDLKDVSGAAFTGTASDITRYALAKGKSGYAGALYLTVADADALTIDVDVITD